MSDKALNNTTLELTQKIQLHFPRDIDSAVLTVLERTAKGNHHGNAFRNIRPDPGGIHFGASTHPPLRWHSHPSGTVHAVHRQGRFRAKKPGARVKFGRVDSDFTDAFGDMVEEPSIGAMLRYDILAKQSAFAPAIEELRASGVITKTTPGELLSLLELQPQGPKSGAGALLADGSAKILRDGRQGWFGFPLGGRLLERRRQLVRLCQPVRGRESVLRWRPGLLPQSRCRPLEHSVRLTLGHYVP